MDSAQTRAKYATHFMVSFMICCAITLMAIVIYYHCRMERNPFFKASESLITGLKKIANGLYYFQDGQLLHGWVKDGQKYYYFSDEGKAIVGWNVIDNSVYYFDANGVRQQGFCRINNNVYLFDKNGVVQSGWIKCDDGKYRYFDKSSFKMKTGWQRVIGKAYYMQQDGSITTGLNEIGGKHYFMNKAGSVKMGQFKASGKYYVANSQGVLETGWHYIDGETYYLDEKTMDAAVGLTEIDGKLYFFDDYGRLQTGKIWVEEDEAYYYFQEDGGLATGNIDGEFYDEETGRLVSNTWDGEYYYNSYGEAVYMEGGLGSAGRLIIPDVGVNVAIYWIGESDSADTAQRVVDNRDSAAYINWPYSYGPTPVVADHWNQGFDGIKQCSYGTTAFIHDGNGWTEYYCYKIDPSGHNIGDIVDSDYNSIYRYDTDGFVCYTCNENWQHVTVVAFAKK